MNWEKNISGLAFLNESLEPENVEIIISDGKIIEINEISGKPEQIIMPKFFNAHTHLADTVAMDIPVDRPLAELVAPPNGLKHQILSQTSDSDLVFAMSDSIQYMKNRGTGGFADFREGGAHGVELLKKADVSSLTSIILGRDGGETIADGYGLSSAHGKAEEETIRAEMKRAGKLFAVHAGEKGCDDIEAAFALEPDFIIHATHFRPSDIRRAADEDIPIVICPRSNWKLNVATGKATPPVRALLDAGCRVYLGTDNVMFVSPDMFAECAFLHTVYPVTSSEILRAAVSGFELAGVSPWIAVGNPASLNCINIGYAKHWSKDILASVFAREHQVM